MIKRIGILAVLMIFLTSCGINKRRAYLKGSENTLNTGRYKKAKKYAKSGNKGAYPLPKDTGKFVKFPIYSVRDYIKTFAEMAQYEMKAYGIPASITLAQGILESGSGMGKLTLNANNHFGIKCHDNWNGAQVFYDDDKRGECFRKYNHPMYSYRDHSEFLSSNSRYAFLFNYKVNDYKKWAKGLRQAGYATDKRYSHKLIALIDKYKLYKYDKITLHRKHLRKKAAKKHKYKVHTVRKGETLYSISNKYFISVPELKRLNNLVNNTISIGAKLIVRTTGY